MMPNRQLINESINGDHDTRLKAIYQMRYCTKEPEMINLLFHICYGDEKSDLQQMAVQTLIVLTPYNALNALKKSTFHQTAEKRMRAYYHLGSMEQSEVHEIIEESLAIVLKGLKDPVTKVRKAAVVSCKRLDRDGRSIKALEKLINSYEPVSIKNSATRSLKIINQQLESKKTVNHNESTAPSFEKSTKTFFKNNKTQSSVPDYRKKTAAGARPERYIPRGF